MVWVRKENEEETAAAIAAAALALRLQRIDQLLDAQEEAVRAAVIAFVNTVGRDGKVLDAITARLEARDVAGALQIVDSYVAQMATVLPAIYNNVGVATAVELSQLLPESAIGVSFDPSHPRAAEIIRESKLEFIRDFTNQQRRATSQALERAFRDGTGTVDTARIFRDSIGLTVQQESAVANYRQLLQDGSRLALTRANRDRRFDRSVEAAAEGRRPLTPEKIDRMVDRYRERTRQMRAETIARTESTRTTSEAREEAMDQMIEQTGLDPARVEGTWNPTRDKRTRDFHGSMAGQKRLRGDPFRDGHGNLLRYPGDRQAPAETVINCRCAVTYSVRPAA